MSLLTSQQINYQFLLLTHMVCADEQIHSEEAKALQELAQQAKMGTRTIEEMEKILSQDENFISVEEVARQLPAGEQSEAMRQIIAIAYVDGYFSPLEREMVKQVAEIWNWSDTEIEKLLKQAQNSGEVKRSINNKDNSELSVSARLLQGADSVLSRALVDNLAKVAPENIGRKVEQLRQEILLAGPEYDDVIKRCAVIASEDYKYAEKSLKNSYDALKSLAKNIAIATESIHNKTGTKGQANTAKEVAKQLESTRNMLTAETLKELEGVRESLRAKQRALNHFSIAFMGKTKAGKSTLHAIITGGGWEAIGVGKQRTTRFNRVYEWKNIRIIDTPGIGAPGGKSDEEIAASVIEESDVICYVVTNDSIQETEFKFLELLKEKAKPLIVLLNIKNNLRDTRRLEHFLKDPHKLFVMDTSSGLGGHIERIRRYAKQHYANDYFEIIPLMLLAAQMSREAEHKEHRDKLFKASRIQDFLNSIRVSLVEHGVIRRSQTLLGSTVGAIDKPNKWVTEQVQIYQQLTEVLKSKRETIRKDIRKAAKDNQEALLQKIEVIFQDVFNIIPDFAEQHWQDDEIRLKLAWEQKLKSIRFKERLTNNFEDNGKQFNQDVQEILEEIGNELKLVAKLNAGSFKFSQQDSMNLRDMFRIGGQILGIAGAIAIFFAPPVGIALGIASTIFNLIPNLNIGWFKSKDQKRREAVQKISSSLSSQVQEYKYTTLEKAKEEFGKYSDAVTLNINNYFDELIQGLELISEQLSEDFLIEISRFQTFIDALNNFVERRGALARFDTPVRIVLASVDEAQLSFTRNSNQDTTFLEVLTQLSRAVRKERESLRTKVHSIALEMSSFIAKEGITLAAAVGTEQDFNTLNKQSEINIQQHYEKAETKLQYVVNRAVEDIREKVAEVLNGNLVQTFITCLSRDLNVSAQNVDSGGKTDLILGQVNWLITIGEKAGVPLKDLATRGFLNSTGVFNNTGLLRSWDVMGSGLHQTILAVGKSVGFKRMSEK